MFVVTDLNDVHGDSLFRACSQLGRKNKERSAVHQASPFFTSPFSRFAPQLTEGLKETVMKEY